MSRDPERHRMILDEPTARLCGRIASSPATDVRLAVVAPGEYGKSALLDYLHAGCERGDIPVTRFDRTHQEEPDPGNLVLVDDAHELDEPGLRRLVTMAADERLGLVVAARPHPRPALLNDVLGTLRSQIVLRRFRPAQVEAYLYDLRGRREAHELAAYVHAQTDGVPGLVRRVTDGLREHSPGTEPTMPESTLTELRHELDQLTPRTADLMLATDAGAGSDLDLLCGALGWQPEELSPPVEAARATGLLGPDGSVPPVVSQALRSMVPVERQLAVRRRLAELQLAKGAPMLPLARKWLGGPLGGASLAKALRSAADEALSTDPALAVRLFDAAATAGIPAHELGARRAEAVALSGDLDTALRLADEVMRGDQFTDRAAGARVAAVALAHRGLAERSAELSAWAATGQSRAFAAVGMLAAGRYSEAEQLLGAAPSGEPPTLLAGALSSMAKGVLDSVIAAPTSALSTLVRSAEMLEPVGSGVLLPDSPAALASLVGVHSGEAATVEPLLERALTANTGGTPMAARHRLLLAWIAMMRGDLDLAGRRLAAAGQPTQPRDWLFSVALEVGLARRANDLGALRRTWGDACTAVIRHPVDLFSFLPFGEFAVAAARLGDQGRVAPHLKRAHELLDGLGNPPLWSVQLHWSELHAAIVAERRDEAQRHADALAAIADEGPYYATVSAAAACWLKVLGGTIDPDEVQACARGLHDAGARWDGARLAGQAAIRTTDRSAMLALLDCARDLHASAAPAEGGDHGAATVRLSERERQVARLVVDGLTYKEVGEQLFISAKTVEHHVARIRQRLGATSRGELLSQLRTLLGPRSPA